MHAQRQLPDLTIILILVFSVIFGTFAVDRYDRYNATGFDLGIFTQLTWNASQGRPLQTTVTSYDYNIHLQGSYTTVLLAPLFWVWADPRTLIIVQTLILTAGAWPAAKLAERVLERRWLGPVFALIWLLFPSIGWMTRLDFHPIALTATMFMFAFEAADRRAWWQVDLWLILALINHEDVGLTVAFFGIYMVWIGQRRRVAGVAWVAIGIAWVLIHAFVIQPHFFDSETVPLRYPWLNGSNLSAWWFDFTGPCLGTKIRYPIALGLPVVYLPLLAPRRLIPALPALFLNLISTMPSQFEIYWYFQATIIPALIVGTIFGAKRLRARLEKRTGVSISPSAVVMLPLSIVLLMTFGPNELRAQAGHGLIYGRQTDAHIAALNDAHDLIPADVCVVAENNIQPAYSTRRESYVIGAWGDGPDGDYGGCQYMIVDLGDTRYDHFEVGEEVACNQFWWGLRTPIFFQETVAILEWIPEETAMPAETNSDAWQQMNDYCAAYAEFDTD